VGTFLLVAVLMFLTAVAFFIWLCVRVVGFIIGLMFGTGRRNAPHQPAAQARAWPRCRNQSCRASNVEHARFCRRCGNAMVVGAVRLRYVA
jgi:hypothetical protein